MTPIRQWLSRVFPPLPIRGKLWTYVILLSAYGLGVSIAIDQGHLPPIEWGAESTVLNGLVLGFFISFRNTHAYDRWWEARKLWGQLTNESRNLCLKIQALPEIRDSERESLGRLVIDFAWALLEHLRKSDPAQPSAADPAAAAPEHRPSRIAAQIATQIQQLRARGAIDSFNVLWLNDELRNFMQVCGACERIRTTPLSSSYRALLRHGLAIYLAIAPFYLIEDTGLSGFPIFVLAAYFLLGIELVAEDIEEPFGEGGENLPLERYCTTIERSTRELLGLAPPHAE